MAGLAGRLVLLAVVAGGSSLGVPAALAFETQQTELSQIAAPADYRAALRQASGLAESCEAAAPACDATQVDRDLRVQPDGYTVHFGWLRTALNEARTAKPAQRASSMAAVAARLQREQRDLDATAPADAHAQAEAHRILATHEFQSVEVAPSWWQQLQARFWRWLDRLLENAAAAGARRPWIGLVTEWTLLAAALAGLLAYVLKALRRERGTTATAWRPGHAEGTAAEQDWAAVAERAAAAGQWREAIHAMYWAAIGSMAVEGRWRRVAAEKAARTPREYLGLLEPGSAQRGNLGSLTALLERAWYARRPAAESEYVKARGLAAALGVKAARQQGGR